MALLFAALPLGAAWVLVLGLGLLREVQLPLAVAGSLVLVAVPPLLTWRLATRPPLEQGALRGAAGVLGAWGWALLLTAATWTAAGTDGPQALRTGLVTLGAPPAMAARAAGLLRDGAAREAAEAGPGRAKPEAPALPKAGSSDAPSQPPAAWPSAEAVVLPYEGSGHSLVLPVQLGDLDASMLFDTGATLTTLGRDTLRSLGVTVPGDAPVLELRTANGPTRVPVVLLPKLWLGGMEVQGVTVGVCEPCADGDVVGLLGLNVTGRFLVTLDTARREVAFAPRAGTEERLLDVGPWLEVDASVRSWPDGRVRAEVRARNRAPREVRAAEVTLLCTDAPHRSWTRPLGPVPAGGEQSRELTLEDAEGCESWSVRLSSARW